MAGGFRGPLFVLSMSAGPEPPPVLYGLPVAKPVALVLVGNVNGEIEGEFRPEIGSVTWEPDGRGEAKMAVTPAEMARLNLQFGKRLLILFDNGLPGWVGTLGSNREWSEGRVTLTALGPGATLNRRRTAAVLTYVNSRADVIIGELLGMVGGMRLAGAPSGSASLSATYNLAPVGDAVDKLLLAEDWTMRVVGGISGGVIEGSVYVSQRWGSVSPAMLVEKHNVGGDVVLREEDVIVNVLTVVGAGTGWGSERAMVTMNDEASVATFGVREEVVFADEFSDTAALGMVGETVLRRGSVMRRAAKGSVVNASPGEFSGYDVGDVVRLILPSFGTAGVSGMYGVLGRAFDGKTGGVSVALEEMT